MSLVSDALKKAEQMRLEQAGVLAPGPRPVMRARSWQAGRLGPSSAKLVWANAAVLSVAFVMAVLYLRRPMTDVEPITGAATSAAAAKAEAAPRATMSAADESTAIADTAATEAVETLPVANTPTAPAYEVCGVTVAGKNTLVGVARRGDGRSAWISVGQTLGDVTVVSYDAQKEQATLRVDGRLVTASMRSGAW